MIMNDIYRIVTPENVELDQEIAGIGSRFLALAIDILIELLFIIGVGYSLTLLGITEDVFKQNIAKLSHSVLGAIVILLGSMFMIGYFVVLETLWNGQTIGKRLIHIRVRKEQGYAPTFWDILLRNIIRPMDFLPFFYALGFLVMFFNPQSKRLGDYAAGTVVVKELSHQKIQAFLAAAKERVLPNQLGLSGKYPWLREVLPYITEQDYYLLDNLYQRRHQLENYQQLCQQAIRQIVEKAFPGELKTPVDNEAVADLLIEMIRIYEGTHML